MRRLAALIALAVLVAGCGTDLYESPDYRSIAIGDDVILWRLAPGTDGFVGIGGPIRPEDMEEDSGPLTLRPYRSADGAVWEAGEPLGTIEDPVLGLTSWDGGFAASGVWDGAPAILLSSDGLTWERRALPAAGVGDPGIEPAGIAAAAGIVVATGFDGSDSTGPLIWRIPADGAPALVEATGIPAGTRFAQVVAGPAGFIAAASAPSEGAAPPPIWISADGSAWDPVLDPFDGDTVVTGLLASESAYVAVVAGEEENRFTLWTSEDGADWVRRADQDSVFARLPGTSGDLATDLAGAPADQPEARPIAFSFNGRWLEITEAVDGRRFVAVAVATDGLVRIVSGFLTGDEPVPLLLIAEG